ncbi:putative transporter SVOPL [Tachyglossus aculeatus]|uniref:putative transporter SVOPL n=1 Tax=Tachyglossus aculeatus TaxID=9261 RepID=UPI0018F5E9A2|nr:putative transporter SVOPL [Tachyglossus aculeatus]
MVVDQEEPQQEHQRKHVAGAGPALSLEELGPEGRERPAAEQKTFTVEEAVETIGFGRFHIALFLIMGSTGVAEAMEIMLIAVVSPVIRCEWHLENWQVALVTTVGGPGDQGVVGVK